MTNFENISNRLNREETITRKISIVTLAGVTSQDVAEGTTIREFKERNGLSDKKLVDDNGDVLTNDMVIRGDMQIYMSTPKKNG